MSYLLPAASGTIAGLVKPGFATTIDLDGTLHARPAARMAGWFNVVLDGGATGNGTTNDFPALTSGVATALAAGLGVYFPPGTYNIGANTLVFGGGGNGAVSVSGVPGRTFIKSTSSTLPIVQIGTGVSPNGLQHGQVHGLIISGPSTPAIQSGQVGLLINAMLHVTISKCEVEYTDIGIDAINNCYGLHVRECRTGFGGQCNVGVNMRSAPNAGCGNQIVFDNCWIYGTVAGFHVSGDVDGINIRNGQCGSGAGGLGADYNGGIIFGKDYLTQSTGFAGMIIVDGVDFEGFSGWALRGYGQANVVVKSCPMISYSNGSSGIQAQGILKATNAGNMSLRLENNSTRGYFASSSAIVIQGYGGGSYFETGSFTDNTYFSGVVCTTQSLFAQSGMRSGVALFHDYAAGDMLLFGGQYLRPSGNGLQLSSDRSSWANVALVAPPAVSYLATLPSVAGGAQPFFAFDASKVMGPSGNPIGSLADLSGFGNVLTESTAARCPILAASVVNSLNGLKFNAGASAATRGTSLVLGGLLNGPLGTLLAGSDLTIIFIARADSPVVTANAQGVGLYLGDATRSNGIYTVVTNYNTANHYVLRVSGGGSPVNVYGGAGTLGSVSKMIVRYTASTGLLKIELNGNAAATATLAADTSSWNMLALGWDGNTGDYTPNMTFCETIGYAALASDSEVSNWKTRNITKWGGN